MNLLICIFLTNLVYVLSEEIDRPRSLVDLTYTYIENDTPTYPLHTPYKLTLAWRGKTKGGIWYLANDIFTGEHVGTHVDAPLHINAKLDSVDVIPIEKLYRIPGILIDISEQVKGNDNYQMQLQDINNWIDEHGPVPDGSMIIVRTGWGKKAHDMKAYRGSDANGHLNFPGIGKDAAEWMVMYKNSSASLKKGVISIAIDTLSFDAGNNRKFDAHLILLNAGIFGIENLANSEKLPAKDFTITMFPMKIGNGSGSPTRMVAEINGTPFTPQALSAAQKLTSYTNVSYFMILLALSTFFFK